MNRIRKISGGLLLLTGILHVAQIVQAKIDAGIIITVAFGIAYLAIGAFLFGDGKDAVYFGTAVPLIGLLLAIGGMFTNPTALGAVFIVIDILIIAGCVYLIISNRKNT